ncbi:MAG TPA: membrane protein insertion efficiency factor YidD [Pseudonocardiaceae bacterium]|nr:membrane protein insertion efficiency factor YidD [Pseudonocardiaceae bacterium]
MAVNFYRRWISPLLPPACRFHPSCSAYAAEALMVHGAVRGTGLAVRRLLKCGPWHPGGYDPVPPRTLEPRSESRSDDHPVEPSVPHAGRTSTSPVEE